MPQSSTAEDLTADIVSKYVDGGLSVRLVGEAVGKSYGYVHRVLMEAGVTLRPRGGSRTRTPSVEADGN
ncbi:helix-turn-helix domain-containing protein [Nonomuraea sp. NPDC050404]|uniref:helix-turn-helix domain-containing protein n=1 Tax=Nonomuraea sp. NPDC050404 TaxID=3155783 RepID=UPI0033FB6082